jgi:hypothetical protein
VTADAARRYLVKELGCDHAIGVQLSTVTAAAR